MLPLAHANPTTAERIRSACTRAAGVLLAVDGEDPHTSPIHHLLPDGSFAVGLPAGSLAACGSHAVLELTDFAPLPLREPVRSLVWVRGQLHRVPVYQVPPLLDLIASQNPTPALLQVQTPISPPPDTDEVRYDLARLEIASVVVTDTTGAEPVDVNELLMAHPDPFCQIEEALLQHLDTDHSDVLERLISKLPAGLRRGQVRPLGLDRYGIRFRTEGDDGDHDIRMPFRQPVDDIAGLRLAIRQMMGCPFVNGLRARF